MRIFELTITNDITYQGKESERPADDYKKHYVKRRYFLGICYYRHSFVENMTTLEPKEDSSTPGFKIGDNGNNK